MNQVRISDYCQQNLKSERINILNSLAKSDSGLPISLVEDLMQLDLDADERLLLLDATQSQDRIALEDFFTRHLEKWPQDLATRALRNWLDRTEHLLWHRLVPLAGRDIVPQRVRYTLVDYAWYSGGRRTIGSALASNGIEELSDTFHAMLLERCVQWNVNHPTARGLATKALQQLSKQQYPDSKAVLPAVQYLARFDAESLRDMISGVSTTWSDSVKLFLRSNPDRDLEKISKLIAKPPKGDFWQKIEPHWPTLHNRHLVDADILQGVLEHADLAKMNWQDFGGIQPAAAIAALGKIADEKKFVAATLVMGGLFDEKENDAALGMVRDRLQSTADPAALLAAIPLRMRLELTAAQQSSKSVFSKLAQEQAAFLNGSISAPTYAFRDHGDGPDARDPDGHSRKRFFRLAFAGDRSVAVGDDGEFWTSLCDAWLYPVEKKLAPLAGQARKVSGIYRLCYLETLGRFAGVDEAALKLLDFIRSDQEDVMRSVVRALAGISSSRANLELIALITRPNVPRALQLEICNILSTKDLSNLQKELRAALNDVASGVDAEEGVWELRDALANLLQVPNEAEPKASGGSVSISDNDLNTALVKKIPGFKQLSSEVKRALRTAQFFDHQVSESKDIDTIDLSPVIDMQYKALELLFRELFEEAASRVIQAGVLQRRLDVIGYARPVPPAMDDFENYIASLPIIKAIPFFSKFKLRKMLRAICQFRPGRRFTLDGLKAFGLFFLCFGRQQCRYGLAGLYETGFKRDEDLFEFVQCLHVMQDFRNRAAHEGFHPDASNNIDGIWLSTAEIIQLAYKVKEGGSSSLGSPVRKVS